MAWTSTPPVAALSVPGPSLTVMVTVSVMAWVSVMGSVVVNVSVAVTGSVTAAPKTGTKVVLVRAGAKTGQTSVAEKLGLA